MDQVSPSTGRILLHGDLRTQRETFNDADSVRIHPILTKGSDVVHAVPVDACLESFCLGVTVESFEDASMKFDRAMCQDDGASARLFL